VRRCNSIVKKNVFEVGGAALVASVFIVTIAAGTSFGDPPTEAPAAFKDRTNGFVVQAAFDDHRGKFEEVEQIKDGLGPVYNSTSCVACHQNPVSGSASQISEVRAGEWINGMFKDHPGGSLVHQRAIDAQIQQHVSDDDNVTTLRMSTNILGDGFVEVISDTDLKATILTQNNPEFGDMRGLAVMVPTPTDVHASVFQVGRFGWKDQHSSLLGFSADAYLNEIGIIKRNWHNKPSITYREYFGWP